MSARQRLKRNGFRGRNYRWVPDKQALLAAISGAESLTAVAEDLGLDLVRLRTAIAHHQAGDALEEARERWRAEAREARAIARQQPLLNRILDLALKVGHTPTQGELSEVGMSHVEINRIFGSVPEAMMRAGLAPNQIGRPPMQLPSDIHDLHTSSTDEDAVARRAEIIRRIGSLHAEPAGCEHPNRASVSKFAYDRDPKVVAWVLQLAEGVCEACETRGYETDSGLAYLEVHHMVPLSEGGPDTVSNTVAVCELCHGKLHRWRDRTQLSAAIFLKVSRLCLPLLPSAP